MEVECKGNTQIIHMEETEITQGTIGLMTMTGKTRYKAPAYVFFLSKTSCNFG